MELLRVMVVGLPGLVGEMIEAAIAASPSLALVRAPDGIDARSAVRELDPAVVVVPASHGALAPDWLSALCDRPGRRAVAIDADRGTGVVYEMRPHAVPIGEVAPDDVVGAILGSRRPDPP